MVSICILSAKPSAEMGTASASECAIVEARAQFQPLIHRGFETPGSPCTRCLLSRNTKGKSVTARAVYPGSPVANAHEML